MKTGKKTCYLFVFDGFADHGISLAATGIRKSDEYRLKTIAISKDPVESMSGMTIVPDLDFRPEVDLDDIDKDNTAMLILPGFDEEIAPLINHCLVNDIPVVRSNANAVDIAQNVFEILGIEYYSEATVSRRPSPVAPLL